MFNDKLRNLTHYLKTKSNDFISQFINDNSVTTNPPKTSVEQKMILSFKQVERATAKLSTGTEEGTAFLINSHMAITAYHVVEDLDSSQVIQLDFVNLKKKIKASILAYDESIDIALLTMKEEVVSTQYLPLQKVELPYDAKWQLYGFPQSYNEAGIRLTGTINSTNEINKWDVQLSYDIDSTSPYDRFSGLSGSAVLIDGYVVGIVLEDLSGEMGTLAAVSINKITNFLDAQNITYDSLKSSTHIPRQIEAGIVNISPNSTVYEKTNQLLEVMDNGYGLICGSPGTGKTTIVADFQPTDEHIEICGKYFVKIPNDDQPIAYRASEETILDWIEQLYHRILHNAPPPVLKEGDKSLVKRKEIIVNGLHQLSDHYKNLNKKGVIFIDGIDDVSRISKQNRDAFFSVFPEKLKDNLIVIFSGVSNKFLPVNLQLLINDQNIVTVTPLSNNESEAYIRKCFSNQSIDIPFQYVSKLVDKSEGHPLYLQYLTQYALSNVGNFDPEVLDNWFEQIPTINGDINKYYNSIWAALKDNEREIEIVATIARLRQSITKSILYEILSKKHIIEYDSSFDKIKHLLTSENVISIYHSSFKDFVKNKTKFINQKIHSGIANYCLSNPDAYYSITNLIHHLLNSNTIQQEQAIQFCKQEWVDKCAIQSVIPDLVLYDIKQVLSFAIDKGNITKVFELLFLLQRIKFRYDEIFKENAAYLVKALLALNRPNEALRYIIRNGELLVDPSNAVTFLQQFYEKNAIAEAEILYNSIQDFCFKRYAEITTDKGLSLEVITADLNSITLSVNKNKLGGLRAYLARKDKMRKFLSKYSLLEEDRLNELMGFVSSFHRAYLLHKYNYYLSVSELENDGYSISKDYSHYTAKLSLNYYTLNNIVSTDSYKENRKLILKDLEYLIEKYGYNANQVELILAVLIEESTNFQLVEKLISDNLGDSKFTTLREDNGVNVNFREIHSLTSYYGNLGYIDSNDTYPIIPHSPNRINWETYIECCLKFIVFLTGKAHRFRAEADEKAIKLLMPKLEKLLDKLSFTLENRIYWHRAYAIPESIIPIIYIKITAFYIEFSPSKIKSFINKIASSLDNQLGLYSEGYIQCLFNISSALSKYHQHKVSTFKVLTVLEKYIEKGIENRWERTSYFLKLIPLYSSINKSKAERVYVKMLQTSMGPSWYKEGQLTLLTSVVGHLKYSNAALKNILSCLDYASGEMTFQRYVNQDKISLIGCLCNNGELQKAINYFKYLTLPDKLTIVNNAESSQIDNIIDSTGTYKGYKLGAREIEEAAGILTILEETNNISLFIKWAYIEMFVNDDIHYMSRYTNMQANILNTLEAKASSETKYLQERLLNMVKSKVAKPFQEDYIFELRKRLTHSNYSTIYNLAITEGIIKIVETVTNEQESLKNNKQEKKLSSESANSSNDRLKQIIEKAQVELTLENTDKAIQILVDGLKNENKYGLSILTDLGKKEEEIIKLISSLQSPEKVIQTFKQFILNEPYREEWVVANKLIRLLGDKFTITDQESILNAVLEHFSLLVRTPEEISQKYEWVDNIPNVKFDSNHLLSKFLTWFLNHPDFNKNAKIIDLHLWLCLVETDLIIPILIEEALSYKAQISTEISAYILYRFSFENAAIVWSHLEKHDSFKTLLKEVPNFLIKFYFIKILEAASLLNKSAKEASTQLNASIPTIFKPGGDVFLDEPWTEFIEDIVYRINKLGILNSDFAKRYAKMVTQLSNPLQPNDLIKLDKYIRRSFYEQKSLYSTEATYIPRYAFSCCITDRVTKSTLDEVGIILSLFPLKS